MTETLTDMGSSMKTAAQEFKDPLSADQATIAQLVKAARARGEDLTGPNGLLKHLTATVLETALDGEMDEHLGYEKHDVAGRGSGNSRNGTARRRC